MINPLSIPLSLYIHTPWCVQKCPYCDFNSHALREQLPEEAYITALCQEFEHKLALIPDRPIHSIFIGGGTPSLFSAEAYARLFEYLQARVSFAPEIEITLEANPGASEQARFRAYRDLGINRLSLGIQSFDSQQLRALGRIHDSDQAHRAIEMARAAGFTRFNLDLMFGLPQQSSEAALDDLRQACLYQPPHLSWYQLTLEPNTYFHKYPPRLPDDDALCEMQQAGIAYLKEQGLERYEISAFARHEEVARHNVNYWLFGDYLGLGAGAHGKITCADGQIIRQQNHKHPTRYLSEPLSLCTQETLASSALPFEFMLNHLRLWRPLPLALFEQRTGVSREVLRKPLAQAQQRGLLTCDDETLNLTTLGYDFLNDVISLFLIDYAKE